MPQQLNKLIIVGIRDFVEKKQKSHAQTKRVWVSVTIDVRRYSSS
jgi:hypothetical protein